MLIGGILFLMMYVWVRAMKIRRHYVSTKPLDDYYRIISDIKADESIPKYASNLVYINHATQEGTVDDKLLFSIINKEPKRADHYWFINMEFVDTPDTLEYSCETLIPNTLYMPPISPKRCPTTPVRLPVPCARRLSAGSCAKTSSPSVSLGEKSLVTG